jgi:hypothetical protein
LWWNPGQLQAGAIPEGHQVTLLYDEPVTFEGVTWVKVQDESGRIGWVSGEYLVELR